VAVFQCRGSPRLWGHAWQISEALRRVGHRPPDGARLWTAEEDALVGTMLDVEVACRVGRPVGAVRCRRQKLRIPSTSGRGPRMRDPKPGPVADGV
jgi:hypothetical protein